MTYIYLIVKTLLRLKRGITIRSDSQKTLQPHLSGLRPDHGLTGSYSSSWSALGTGLRLGEAVQKSLVGSYLRAWHRFWTN